MAEENKNVVPAGGFARESTQGVIQSLLVRLIEKMGEVSDSTAASAETTKKTRSDAGKHHDWTKKDGKSDEKGTKEIVQKLGFMGGMLKAGKALQERAAKLAKVGAGKVKDFAVSKIAGIKKAAGSLLDLLKKGLGLGLLWLLFKAIKEWDIEAIIAGAKKAGEAILGIADFMLDLAISIGAWMGFEKIAKLFTGKEGPLTKKITKWMTKLTGKGSFFGKIGNLFSKIGGLFGKIPGVGKILKFVKGAAKFLGKIFIPVTVIMALWEAVSGFMKGFEETEGNMAQKIMGGISGAIKGLLDFFVFGIAEMVQDAIVWLLELFGFDDAAIAVDEFDFVGKIKDALFKAFDFLTELFAFDDLSPFGIFKSLIDIVFLPLNLAINFVKNLFGFGDPEKPFKFSEWIFEMFDKVWKWITEELLVNPVDALKNLVTGLLGGYVGFLDWILAMIKKPVVWLLEMFGWDDAAGAVEKFTLKGFLMESWNKVKAWLTGLLSWAATEDEDDSIIVKYVKKAITGVKEWFGKMFDFSSAAGFLKSYINVLTFFPNMIKDAVFAAPEWLLGLFGFDDAAKKVANANNWSIGGLVMDAIDAIVEFIKGIFDFDFGGMIKGLIDSLPSFIKMIIPDAAIEAMTEAVTDDGKAMGGPVGAGVPTLVGEHGPEMFVPSASGRILPRMQTENAMGGGGGAPMIICAPTSNVSNGSATMSIASSSINPMNEKYFRN